MQKTKIEWVRNPDGTQGYTFNPITGCLNGCEYCYARKLANGRLRSRMLANPHIAGEEAIIPAHSLARLNPFYPRFWERRLDELPLVKGPDTHPPRKGIFVCSMGDLFGEGVPELWTASVFDSIRAHPEHRFYLLTKQPQNLAKWSPFPSNCWVGVSVTDSEQMNAALYYAKDVQATVRFLSFEPLLERIDLSRLALYVWDWVIIGAQTKPYVAPKVEWVTEIVEAADAAGIPVFLKDSLKPMVFGDPLFAEGMVTWAGELRQEMPE